ncbi:HlyD family secretion protein [Paenibacillus silviterrae]|uniref:HlyD family secretion protein n=1 Tax=Paenibacillus silviterrae TaxID=3242194 RepID=UPI002543C17D|nr:HlyD family efflux transporter periplasmic adaptor subunit [Paenibacillus chinjuensis]
MKIIRPMVYSLFAAMIGTGFFFLHTGQVDSSTGAQRNGATAYIEATQVSASFKVGGRVTELLVKEGDTVKQGQPIARLQSNEIEAKVAQAKAAVGLAQGKIAEATGAEAGALAKKQQGAAAVQLTAETAEQQVAQAQAAVQAAEAKVQALKNGARPEEKKQAEAQLNAAKEVYDVAEQSLKRMNTLLAEGLIAKADADKAKVSFEEAKAKYELAQQQAALVNQGPRPEEIQGAEAMLEQARASLRLAEAGREQVQIRQGDVAAAEAAARQARGAIQSAESGKLQAEASQLEAETYLSYTELLAPADGIIVAQNAQLGELVGSGFPIYTVEASGSRWAKFYLPETELTGLKSGDNVSLKLAATGAAIQGKVQLIAPAADFAVKKATQAAGDTDIRSFGVKIELTEVPENTATGMTLQWAGRAEEGVRP